MRDSGHVDRYTNLKLKYIDHHNPDLVLLDKNGAETHRVDLTRLSSTQSIHKLCQLLGLEENCRDETAACAKWAAEGECERNADYMSDSCRRSCKLCGADAKQVPLPACRDLNGECSYWATMGECDQNPSFMLEQCAKSCGGCTADKDEL